MQATIVRQSRRIMTEGVGFGALRDRSNTAYSVTGERVHSESKGERVAFMFRRRFRLVEQEAIQVLSPKFPGQRFEGIAFSPSGAILGVATADTDAVLLFRRQANGRFDDEPYQRIEGLSYPHDVSFAKCGDHGLLAIAQRGGSICVLRENVGEHTYGPDPVCVIDGPESRLHQPDGVAFVPPDNDYLAACNLTAGSIGFYRRTSQMPPRFNSTPAFELSHSTVFQPDGLAFSSCGRWLATANHGGHSVSVFERRMAADGALRYGPEPAAVIADPTLRHPHSVAFTDHGHLVATNAGANYFSVYRTRQRSFFRAELEQPESVHRQTVNDEAAFREVNSQNKMEGGPKGIAIHSRTLAICSPEIGIKIYSFRG
jgi:hypothetical protein